MKPLRLGTAVSAVALATMVAGCASPMSRSAQVSKGKANMAYALRAQMAIDSNDYASAVGLAESAVEASPQDANVRGLLGNAYFGAGRFASAEAAYGDSLSLAAMQPSVILKRALVQIAQGKNDEGFRFSSSRRASSIRRIMALLSLLLVVRPMRCRSSTLRLAPTARMPASARTWRSRWASAATGTMPESSLRRIFRLIRSTLASSSGCRLPSRRTPTTRLPR
ncbi:tetratricopeptide repeat protein [Sphingomonas daechungensis]|uniref:tetratricopeptide repeat protein n=1 Tax=Sphingomonas daechungensis TaxID=1176646 RepID=UPI0037830C45